MSGSVSGRVKVTTRNETDLSSLVATNPSSHFVTDADSSPGRKDSSNIVYNNTAPISKVSSSYKYKPRPHAKSPPPPARGSTSPQTDRTMGTKPSFRNKTSLSSRLRGLHKKHASMSKTHTQTQTQTHARERTCTLNSEDWLNDVLEAVLETVELGRREDYSFVPSANKLENLESMFSIIHEIGSGATSRVLLVEKLENDVHVQSAEQPLQQFALKQLRRDDECNLDLFNNEYKLLHKLDHPNITRFCECYMDRYNYYIVTEYCDGGSLMDQINHVHAQNKVFSELEASACVRSILTAVEHCHKQNIAHRDIKPGNIMFESKISKFADLIKIVLIDFGIAVEIEDHETDEEYVGTLIYLPPESVRERQGWELRRGDVWAVGIIAYVLVCGMAPFSGVNHARLLVKIMSQEVEFPEYIKLSEPCKDFITKLLKKEPRERPSATEALTHEWLPSKDVLPMGNDAVKNKENNDAPPLQRTETFDDLMENATISKMNTYDQEVVMNGLDRMETERDPDGTFSKQAIFEYLRAKGVSEEKASKRAEAINKMAMMSKKGRIEHRDFVRVATEMYETEEKKKPRLSLSSTLRRNRNVNGNNKADGKKKKHDENDINNIAHLGEPKLETIRSVSSGSVGSASSYSPVANKDKDFSFSNSSFLRTICCCCK